jgi:hypothetical protein
MKETLQHIASIMVMFINQKKTGKIRTVRIARQNFSEHQIRISDFRETRYLNQILLYTCLWAAMLHITAMGHSKSIGQVARNDPSPIRAKNTFFLVFPPALGFAPVILLGGYDKAQASHFQKPFGLFWMGRSSWTAFAKILKELSP